MSLILLAHSVSVTYCVNLLHCYLVICWCPLRNSVLIWDKPWGIPVQTKKSFSKSVRICSRYGLTYKKIASNWESRFAMFRNKALGLRYSMWPSILLSDNPTQSRYVFPILQCSLKLWGSHTYVWGVDKSQMNSDSMAITWLTLVSKWTPPKNRWRCTRISLGSDLKPNINLLTLTHLWRYGRERRELH